MTPGGFQVRPFPDSVLATVVEAVIGGLYPDADWSTAREFVLRRWPTGTAVLTSVLDLDL